ncbi:MAG: hypothetical protein ABIZ70_07985 [Gemmatimonadales bacterium]
MPSTTLETAVAEIVEAIDRWLEAFHTPLLVVIDGRSGTGKSVIAARVAESFGAALVHADDFFDATVTAAEWDARSAAERARDYLDWRRLRSEALLPLLDGNPSEASGMARVEPRPVILLKGVYASRPELVDLAGLTVLVQAPDSVARERLAAGDGAAERQRRWAPAERHFFQQVRPVASFDLVVQNP